MSVMAGKGHNYNYKRWIAVFGMFLVLCPQAMMWYWANLSVYVNSYITQRVHDISPTVESNWFIACFEIGSSIGIFIAGFLSPVIGNRFTLLLGTSVFLSASVCSYFIIDVSGLAMKITAGTVAGGGLFITNGAAIQYTMALADGDFGYIHSVVQGGLTGGSIAVNQLITWYINPDNHIPDHTVGPSVYFSQTDVLDRVPSVFLIIAGCAVGCYIVGVLMVELGTTKSAKITNVTNGRRVSYGATCPEVNNAACVENCSHTPVTSCNGEPTNIDNQTTPSTSNDMTIGQAMRTSEIYIYMLLMTIGVVTFSVNVNYYKAYGQLYVKDDHFITNLSLGVLLSATVSRPGWGWLLDRYSIKTVYIIFFSWSGISSLCFYFSPILDKWFYAFMTIMFTVSGGPMYIISTVACMKTFGETHTVVLCGMVFLPPGVFMLFTPIIYQVLLDSFGWFSIYASCCGMSIIGIFVCITTRFKKRLK